jgi:hypothetical protein
MTMLRRIACILAAVVMVPGCFPVNQAEDTPTYTLTGEIIDPDASVARLMADMHVTATNRSNGNVYAASVDTDDSKTCRYLLEKIPSAEYSLVFSSPFYETAEYSLDLKSDKTLDVNLSPIPRVSLDVQEIHIAPREKSTVFSVTNLTGKEVSLYLRPNGEIIQLIERLSGFQKVSEYTAWRGTMAPGETRKVTLQVRHDLEESVREGFFDIQVNGIHDTSLPFAIETTHLDFYGNLVGRVTDGQGHPLADIPIYCDCTDTIVLTDAEGRYSFDDLPYLSLVSVTALPEFYNWKRSESKPYVIDEIEIDLALEPCTNHLVLDRTSVDFGSGSISNPGSPVSFNINVTAEKDDPVMFQVMTKVVGGEVYPGLNYTANGSFQSSLRLRFQLDRSVGKVGDFSFTAILKTDCAGVYFIPVRFSNTE